MYSISDTSSSGTKLSKPDNPLISATVDVHSKSFMVIVWYAGKVEL